MSDGAQLKAVGQNATEEFFETILYQLGYNEMRALIQTYTKDIESPILKDAIESSMNVLVFGALFYAIQKQEQVIEYIYNTAEGIVVALVLKAKNGLLKLKRFKGTKLFRYLSFLQGKNQDDLNIAQIVATHQGLKGVGSATSQNNQSSITLSKMGLINSSKQTLQQRETHHMQFGNAMASRYNETLLFKLFTKSFTANDEMLIKKILGRDTGSVLDVADLNQVADFLFIKDTNGKVTGLSEAFFSLVNGLGYLHNK